MGEEMTPGEIARAFDRVEAAARATNDRLAESAREMVPAKLWAAEHQALTDQIRRQDRDAREARDRIEKTASERLATVNAEIQALREDLRAHKQEHAASAAWSRSRVLTTIGIVVGAAATLAGAWIAAVLASRGVH